MDGSAAPDRAKPSVLLAGPEQRGDFRPAPQEALLGDGFASSQLVALSNAWRAASVSPSLARASAS
jgi:hypothetical protein